MPTTSPREKVPAKSWCPYIVMKCPHCQKTPTLSPRSPHCHDNTFSSKGWAGNPDVLKQSDCCETLTWQPGMRFFEESAAFRNRRVRLRGRRMRELVFTDLRRNGLYLFCVCPPPREIPPWLSCQLEGYLGIPKHARLGFSSNYGMCVVLGGEDVLKRYPRFQRV